MKIVVASRVVIEPIVAALSAVPGLELVVCKDHSEVPQAMRGAEVLVLSDPKGNEGAPIAAALRAPDCSVRWIQVTTAGADGLLPHGVPPDIVITNQGGAVAPVVAESAMGMILALAHQFPAILARSARREWIKEFPQTPIALEGLTLAIVGYGHLGRQLAQRARGFEMQVLGLSRSRTSDDMADEMHPLSQLHAVLARADVVAVTIASSSATRHIIDAAALGAVKRDALFVNVSRGETVDQGALRAALQDGRLRAAFLDVTEPEPLPPGNPLWDAPNLLISPHVAGHGGTRTVSRLLKVLTGNMQRFIAGESLLHRMGTVA